MNTNSDKFANKNKKQNANCQCMNMNQKYAEGFVKEEPIVEEDITIEEEVSRN